MLRKCEKTLKNINLIRTIWSRTTRVCISRQTRGQNLSFFEYFHVIYAVRITMLKHSRHVSQMMVFQAMPWRGGRMRGGKKKLLVAYHKVFIFSFSQKLHWRAYATLIQRCRQSLILCQVGMVPILIVILGSASLSEKMEEFR